MLLGGSIATLVLPSMALADGLHKWVYTPSCLGIVSKEMRFITQISVEAILVSNGY